MDGFERFNPNVIEDTPVPDRTDEIRMGLRNADALIERLELQKSLGEPDGGLAEEIQQLIKDLKMTQSNVADKAVGGELERRIAELTTLLQTLKQKKDVSEPGVRYVSGETLEALASQKEDWTATMQRASRLVLEVSNLPKETPMSVDQYSEMQAILVKLDGYKKDLATLPSDAASLEQGNELEDLIRQIKDMLTVKSPLE